MHDPRNNPPQIQLTPVGKVHSEIETPSLQPGKSDIELKEGLDKIKEYHEKIQQVVCDIEIFREWEELLNGIDGFSHILVLYWPHLIDPEKRHLREIHPMGREDMPRQGVFATCSPARPNPVLVSAVSLLEKKGNILRVKGLEAVDDSPVIDIKPYIIPYYAANNPTVPDWMIQIHRELGIDIF